MNYLVVTLFGLTYLGMALGRAPGLKIDRAGIAMIVAVVLAAVGAVRGDALARAVDFPALLVLGGLMVLSARVSAGGVYDATAVWIARRADRPLALLALTTLIAGLLSAFFVNDVVVFALTPPLCAGLKQRRLDPRPFLLGLAAASNAGSAATLIGNPQNILIGQVGHLAFWRYLAEAAVPSLAAVAISFACIAFFWRANLATPAAEPLPEPIGFDRIQTGIAAAGLIALLGLFTTRVPREISALLVAACLLVSRKVPSRRLLAEIDLPLLILLAGLFVINDAFVRTGLPQVAVRALGARHLLPDRILFLAPLSLLLSNTIGNVPAVVMILKVWQAIPAGVLVGLAILSTLAGNLLLVGSLANLIVAERASLEGVRLTFADHAKAGIPITLLSILVAGLWLWGSGLMAF